MHLPRAAAVEIERARIYKVSWTEDRGKRDPEMVTGPCAFLNFSPVEHIQHPKTRTSCLMWAHLLSLHLDPTAGEGGEQGAFSAKHSGKEKRGGPLPVYAMHPGLTIPVFILSDPTERKINFKTPIKNPFSQCVFGYSSLHHTLLHTDV